MVTAAAYSVLCYSLIASAAGATLWLLGLRLAMLRGVGSKVTITFAVFAIASAYVWLTLGPDIDFKAALRYHPLHLAPDPPLDV